MLSLLISVVVSASNSDIARCRSGVVEQLHDIGTFAIGPVTSRGRTTFIRGAVDELARAPAPLPGMMAPTHVLVIHYTFRCVLQPGSAPRVSLKRKRD